MVRENGVSKNWAWWAFLITGMVTVFIYAKLWRRSGVMTDLEFYELRYGGKPASFLRGFRAVYLGVFFNILIMATVTLAIIKYGSIMFGVERWEAVVYGSVGVVIYATLGGIKGCIWADFFQYGIAMFGAVYAGYVAIAEAGKTVAAKAGLVGEKATEFASNYSISDLLSNSAVADKIDIFPDFTDASQWIPLLLMPIAVQWWAAWYPGAEPGGGGYIAQRMLSAKDEKNAIGATLFFNFAHYALRPWPWIVVALASLVAFPMDSEQDAKKAAELLKTPAYVKMIDEVKGFKAIPKDQRTKAQEAVIKQLMQTQLVAKRVSSIGKAFSHIEDETVMAQDISYPAMISRLSPGFLGLVIASIIAAYMSTIGTHLNWGSSYAVNDFYKRFIKPDATEKQMVAMGRYCTVGFMVLAGTLACYLESATQAFNILLLSGAGSGAIYLLRWFWWRISAWSEIFAMVVTTIVAIILVLFVKDEDIAFGVLDGYSVKFLIAVGATTIAWLAGTFLTKPESEETLRAFVRKCHPGGPGWAKVVAKARAEGDFIDEKIHGHAWEMPIQILCVFLGCVAIYCALFSIGSFLYGNLITGTVLGLIAIGSTFVLFKSFGKLRTE
jgi:Na+/proline symporter